MELLLPEISEERPHPGKNIIGAPDRLVFPSRFHGSPPSQLHGCRDSGRGGHSDARLGLQDTWRKGGETTKRLRGLGPRGIPAEVKLRDPVPCQGAPNLMEQLIRHIQCRSEPSPTANKDRQQFSNGENRRSQGSKSLPGPIAPRP